MLQMLQVLHTDEPSVRECRECGAALSNWDCEVCGGFALQSVSNVPMSDLLAAWRTASGADARPWSRAARVA